MKNDAEKTLLLVEVDGKIRRRVEALRRAEPDEAPEVLEINARDEAIRQLVHDLEAVSRRAEDAAETAEARLRLTTKDLEAALNRVGVLEVEARNSKATRDDAVKAAIEAKCKVAGLERRIEELLERLGVTEASYVQQKEKQRRAFEANVELREENADLLKKLTEARANQSSAPVVP